MIPFIRSLSELTAITKSRDIRIVVTQNIERSGPEAVDSGQRKRYIRSLSNKEIDLPNLPKTIRRKWTQKKESVSRFIDDLDYNNQIQPSYDLTLIERQNKTRQEDVA